MTLYLRQWFEGRTPEQKQYNALFAISDMGRAPWFRSVLAALRAGGQS